MTIDLTHDTQSCFRSLTRALSFPGRIINLNEANKIRWTEEIPSLFILLAQTLMDGESTFSYLGKSDEGARLLSQITYAKETEIERADFIFVEEEEDLIPALERAKRGDLENPQTGATVITRARTLERGNHWIAEGPGIKKPKDLLLGLTTEWDKVREEINREYPLGVDILLTDQSTHLMALPRTTKLRRA